MPRYRCLMPLIAVLLGGSSESGGDPFVPEGATAPDAGRLPVVIRGQPYGYYDTGTLVSVIDTSLPVRESRAAVNGGFEAGVTAMAAYSDFDSVNLYNEVGATPPRLMLSGVTYDAGHIYPAAGTKFTPPQLAMLRPAMWVMTNSVDPSVPAGAGAHRLPAPDTFGSTVLRWSPEAIVVSGWTVPGSGHVRDGQVPPAAPVQTVVFGSATKQFARNTVMTHRPNVAGSSTRAYEAEEVDMNDLGTQDYGASWHGYTVHYTPAGIVPAGSGQPAHNVRPTSDSYGVNISGPLPTLLQLQSGIPGTRLIDSESLRLLVGASPAPPVGSRNLLSDQSMYIDSNRAHLLTYMVRDIAGGGAPTASVHLGLRYDSTFGVLDGSGTGMGEIVWNPQGAYGGVRICGATGACGLTVKIGGAVVVAQHTPSSSSEPCTPGQTSDDAAYHYWCATQNHWLRVAGTAF